MIIIKYDYFYRKITYNYINTDLIIFFLINNIYFYNNILWFWFLKLFTFKKIKIGYNKRK